MKVKPLARMTGQEPIRMPYSAHSRMPKARTPVVTSEMSPARRSRAILATCGNPSDRRDESSDRADNFDRGVQDVNFQKIGRERRLNRSNMPECAILGKRGANWTKEELGSSRGIEVKMSWVCDFCPNQLKENEKQRFPPSCMALSL
ncbi:hypothetical protein ACHMW4_07300 [Mesorhizobium sp. UC22_110]|uniref:hypothetical protein n=1 Tax=Mesorhizobium sp. UC22_110 TaxID=3374552 RepID=UPI003757C52C